MSALIRKYFLPLHLWAGLTTGLVLVVMALTGCLMAFRTQLDPVVNRELLVVPPGSGRVPLDQLVAQVQAVHPGDTLDFIRYYGRADASALIRYTNKATYYFNPYTGAVLGRQDRYRGFFGTLENIHRFRFMTGGSLVTGTTALVFVGIIITGISLWWPTTVRALRAGLTFNRRLSGRPWYINLHKTVGFYAAVVVGLSALTGLPQAFEWYRHGIYHLTGSPLSAEPEHDSAAAAPALPMEAFALRVSALVPGASETLIHFPSKGRVEIYAIPSDAPHPNARTLLWLDATTGETLSFTPYSASSMGHRLYFWTISWHLGQVGGLFTQILIFCGALSVPLLAYTGTASYLRRKSGQPSR